eukprot:g492.t1
MTSNDKTVGVQKTLEFFFERQDDLPHKPKPWSLRANKGSFLWELLNTQVLGSRSASLRRSQWRMETTTHTPKAVSGNQYGEIRDLDTVWSQHLLIARASGIYLRDSEDPEETVEVHLVRRNSNLVSALDSDYFLSATLHQNEISLDHTHSIGVTAFIRGPENGRQWLSSGYTDLKNCGEKMIFASTSQGCILHWDHTTSVLPIRCLQPARLNSTKTELCKRISGLQLLLNENLVVASTLSPTVVFWDVRRSLGSIIPVMQTENLTASIRAYLDLDEVGPVRTFGLNIDPWDASRLAFVSRVHPLGIMTGVLHLRTLTVSQMKMLNPDGMEDAGFSIKSSWCPNTGTFITGNLSPELCFVNLENWTPPENSLAQDVVKFPVLGAIDRLRRIRTRVADESVTIRKAVSRTGEITSSFKKFTQSRFYTRVLQGSMYTIHLTLVDAAYSGDWSKVGMITPDTELHLRSICLGILGVNTLSSFATALLNITRNKPWLFPSFATLGIGVLNLVQHVYEDEKTSTSKLTTVTAIGAAFGALTLLEAIVKSAHFGTV